MQNSNNYSNNMTPENHYNLNNNKNNGIIGYYPPNTLGEAIYDNVTDSNNKNKENNLNLPKSNDNPSLRQAEIAYEEGGSTTGDFYNNNSNYTGNSYLGNLQKLAPIENIDKMDATSPEIAYTPATFNYGATISEPLRETLGIGLSEYQQKTPITTDFVRYHNGFLRTQIGRRITVDFLVGSNQIVSKTGYLLGVAQDYILLNEIDTNDITSCDFYTIKFMRFYY